MSDQGFGRNLQTIFGLGETFEGMNESPIAKVEVAADMEHVRFTFENGRVIGFRVEGDCCSRSWIEHVDIPPAVIGQMIVEVSDAQMDRLENEEYECLQVYNTRFKTPAGDVVLEYRNSSNGYYGGYLVREP